MADQKDQQTQKVLTTFKEDGAYGLMEIEIQTAILKKHGKVLYRSEPDIFAVFVNNITKKARELFGI